MNDRRKNKAQLIRELSELRRQIAEYYTEFLKKELLNRRDELVSIVSSYRKMTHEDRANFRWPGMAGTVRRVLEEASTPVEQLVDRTLDFLGSKDFGDLPFVRISTAMFAELVYRAGQGQRRQPTPGFRTDVAMLATLMPYCDAIFVDKECGSMPEEARVRDKVRCDKKVFSLRDRDAFLEYLNSIESSMTDEHLAKVVEVYGESWKADSLGVSRFCSHTSSFLRRCG
jgi:hypothetical protein